MKPSIRSNCSLVVFYDTDIEYFFPGNHVAGELLPIRNVIVASGTTQLFQTLLQDRRGVRIIRLILQSCFV